VREQKKKAVNALYYHMTQGGKTNRMNNNDQRGDKYESIFWSGGACVH